MSINTVVSIQDVLQTNPTIQITEYTNEKGTFNIIGFIDMDCSAGYSDIIKIKDKSFHVNYQSRKTLIEEDVWKCRTIKDLVSLLNIRSILSDTPDI